MSLASEPGRAPDRPKLLLIDTCGSVASAAVTEGDEVLGQTVMPGRSASEELLRAVAELLTERRWKLQELHALAVVRGPGSFTGIRVGLSTAKGLAEASGLPLLALSRLEVMARIAPAEAIVTLDAGRGEVFWAQACAGATDGGAIASREWVMAHARELGVPVVEEEGRAEPASAGRHAVPALTAAHALPLALARFEARRWDDALLLDGLYLHRTEGEILERQRSHQRAGGQAAGQP